MSNVCYMPGAENLGAVKPSFDIYQSEEQLMAWSSRQRDHPDIVESVRRILGVGVSVADWRSMQRDAGEIDLGQLPAHRQSYVLGRLALAGYIALSQKDHPPFSDLADGLNMLIQRFPDSIGLALVSALSLANRENEPSA